MCTGKALERECRFVVQTAGVPIGYIRARLTDLIRDIRALDRFSNNA